MTSIVNKQFICLALWALLTAGFVQAACPSAQTQPLPTAPTHSEPGRATQMNAGQRGRDDWQKPDEVLQAMQVQPGQVIVDIGAGNGYFTWRFAEAVGPTGKAIGVDSDAAAVRNMMADAKRRDLTNYEARLVPADDPQLAPNSVDVIFLCDAYHEINDRVAYFTRVKAALRAGGRLVIIDFVRTQQNNAHSSRKEDVVSELQQAGYRLTKELDLLLPRQMFLTFEPATQTTTGITQ